MTTFTGIAQTQQYCNYFSLFTIFLLIILFISTSKSTEILITPEDVRFAFNRCKNNSETINSNLNWNQLWIWMPWRITKNQKEMHCLIKCFLTKLGLINLKDRGLDKNKTLSQIKGFYKNDINNFIIEDDLEESLNGPLNGTCYSYYIKWLELMENYGQIIRKAFYGYKEDVINFYQENALAAKDIGITAIEFCNKNNISEKDLILNLIWKIPLSNYNCYLKCIFQHFHYFDAYGRVDVSELLRNAQESGFLDSSNQRKIEFCAHSANQLFLHGLCEMASELNRCLLSNVHNAKEMILHRNQISRFY